jgi:hypothetical protein
MLQVPEYRGSRSADHEMHLHPLLNGVKNPVQLTSIPGNSSIRSTAMAGSILCV